MTAYATRLQHREFSSLILMHQASLSCLNECAMAELQFARPVCMEFGGRKTT